MIVVANSPDSNHTDKHSHSEREGKWHIVLFAWAPYH